MNDRAGYAAAPEEPDIGWAIAEESGAAAWTPAPSLGERPFVLSPARAAPTVRFRRCCEPGTALGAARTRLIS